MLPQAGFAPNAGHRVTRVSNRPYAVGGIREVWRDCVSPNPTAVCIYIRFTQLAHEPSAKRYFIFQEFAVFRA
jgi:hypothetical protein